MKAWTHGLAVVATALVTGAAFADFDGPAPVAWRWAQPTSAVPGGAPLVDGDTVYTAVGGRIYGLERQTGNQVWRFPVAEPLDSNFRNGVAMGGGLIVAITDNRTVYAVDKATGALKWQWTSQESVTGSPVIAGDRVVVGTLPGGLMSLDIKDGHPAWKESLKLKGAPYPNMATIGDNVIVLTNAPSVTSINVGTGKQNWSVGAGSLSGNSVPAIFGDTIYINTGYYLTALRGTNGAKRWDKRMDETLAFGPAASEQGVAVVSLSGTVYTFDTQGNFVFKKGIKLGSSPVTQPSYVGKLVAVGTENGSLNIVDPKSGEMVYNYVVPPLIKGAKISGGNTGNSGNPRNNGGNAEADNEIKYVQVAGAATAAGDTMLVLVRDGSLIAFDKTLGVDLTPPTVGMLWPNPGDQVAGVPPLELWFKIEDAASGINPNTVKVTISGTEYNGNYTKDGYLSITLSAVGANKPLMDGRADIVVSASDWLGNHTDAKFVLSIDNTLPPMGGPPRKVNQGGNSGLGGVGGGGGKGGG